MPFYDEMAAMVADLLKPDTAGGLGMGSIQIVRLTPGLPTPGQEHIPVPPSAEIATVNQINTANEEYVDRGTVILADRMFMVTPPQWGIGPITPGDVVIAPGFHGTVIHVQPFGSNDVPIYCKVYANGGGIDVSAFFPVEVVDVPYIAGWLVDGRTVLIDGATWRKGMYPVVPDDVEYEWMADGVVVGNGPDIDLTGMGGVILEARIRARHGDMWSEWINATGGGIVDPWVYTAITDPATGAAWVTLDGRMLVAMQDDNL